MSSREFKNSLNCFCYVCGFYISSKHITYKIIKETKYWTAYRLYFGIDIGDSNKPWGPHIICSSCRSNLEGWLRGSGKVMSFAVSRIWRELQNHHDDCYFCMINISKYHKISERRAITYPSTPSSIVPVPHNGSLRVPNTPSNVSFCLWITNTNLFVLILDSISYTVCYVAYLLFIILGRNVLQ